MKIAVPSETFAGEGRVALAPGVVASLTKAGHSVLLQAGAGERAGFRDKEYQDKGVTIVADRAELFAQADIIAQVRCHGANPDAGEADLPLMRSGQIVVGHCEPLLAHEQTKAAAAKGLTLLSMELIPRTTRAQSMDALSSQANLVGYKGVLMAANMLPQVFPMMMTAAGTLRPAKVFIIGAGVAGLQAIATAKRLGAIVSAIDVRPAVKEQVESLGAKFVMPPGMAEGAGGYAKEQTEEQKKQQQQMMADTVAESDVVITTAAIPGRKSPVLVTTEMVQLMKPRSVIVDLASERGGNCALTEPGKTVEKFGVTIVGALNVAATIPHDASQMYAKNVASLLIHMSKDGAINLDADDEITKGVIVCRGGEIVHPQVRQAMGLSELPKPVAASEGSGKP